MYAQSHYVAISELYIVREFFAEEATMSGIEPKHTGRIHNDVRLSLADVIIVESKD
jgi:hypothetical protein